MSLEEEGGGLENCAKACALLPVLQHRAQLLNKPQREVTSNRKGRNVKAPAVEKKEDICGACHGSTEDKGGGREVLNDVCGTCQSSTLECLASKVIVCDGCGADHHFNCVGLNALPAGDWYCTPCTESRRVKTCCTQCPKRVEESEGVAEATTEE